MARHINEEPGLQYYVDAVERLPLPSREEELELARRWRENGDRRARRRLVESHLRSVIKLALKYRGYGIYLSDLIAEGNLGLLEALNRFEPQRGLRFLTYARYWIRAYMLAHVLKHWSIVDMGTTALQSKMFFRLQAEHAKLVGELGEGDKSIESRLADKFQTSVDHVRTSLERLGRRDASLDAPLTTDSGATHLDMLRADEQCQESQFARAQLSTLVQETVAKVWPKLDCRERLIIESRLLVPDGEAKTLAALGRQLGVTRERVRQLEAGVKAKLRQALERSSDNVATVVSAAAA
ncbi:MAG: sigma-70 family RNA polymerase sigma factor [Myxococcota bacterium]